MSLEAPRPQLIVLFGASGDLARKKVLPALYNLSVQGALPERHAIVGFAMTEWDDDAFREHAREAVEGFSHSGLDEDRFKVFADSLSFVSGGFDDDEAFDALGERLTQLDRRIETDGGRLFYLATPPSFFGTIPERLRTTGQVTPAARIVIEKPFGHDLESARQLTARLHTAFDERCIFRIDHYLGKETVQNLVVFRFGNSLFERVWNADAIDSLQVTVAEDIGVEGRASYYDGAGAIRDLLQNHMLQVLSFVTMEPPRSLEPEAFRDEKVKLLRAVLPLDPAEVIRGQYEGYRDEDGVAADSTTETYIAARLRIENWRWDGVPIFLRHGKRLPRRATEVTVRFKDAPRYLYDDFGVDALTADHLTIRVQPDEGISLAFEAKMPGPGYEVKTVRMDFDYERSFMHAPAEAYERLLHDAMNGDHTLFTREDDVERSWEIVAPVLEHPGRVHPYRAGSWGPPEADALIAPRHWHLH
jgi:glucose-6-phosphate 1-dehydrogenase